MMTTTMGKTLLVFLVWAITLPIPSITNITGVIFGFYIINMLYFNIVKVHFGGSWKAYFKSITSPFKSKLIKLWQFLQFWK